jgi:hypothetical protein
MAKSQKSNKIQVPKSVPKSGKTTAPMWEESVKTKQKTKSSKNK